MVPAERSDSEDAAVKTFEKAGAAVTIDNTGFLKDRRPAQLLTNDTTILFTMKNKTANKLSRQTQRR
jgi:hypothetical protein